MWPAAINSCPLPSLPCWAINWTVSRNKFFLDGFCWVCSQQLEKELIQILLKHVMCLHLNDWMIYFYGKFYATCLRAQTLQGWLSHCGRCMTTFHFLETFPFLWASFFFPQYFLTDYITSILFPIFFIFCYALFSACMSSSDTCWRWI